MQTILIFAVSEGFADNIIPDEMEKFEKKLFKFFREEKKDLSLRIRNAKKFDDELKNELRDALGEFAGRL